MKGTHKVEPRKGVVGGQGLCGYWNKNGEMQGGKCLAASVCDFLA